MEINEQTFEMLIARFDRVDRDNEEIMKSLAAHIQEDNAVHEVVAKHSTYWSLLLWISGATIIGSVGTWFKSFIK